MSLAPRPPQARPTPAPQGLPGATLPVPGGAWRMGLFLACCAAFVYGVFRPEPPPQLFEESDKAMHVLAFGALALSMRLAFARARSAWIWGPLLALAPLVEYLQHALQPARHFSLGDIHANLLGVGLALAASMLIGRLSGSRA